MDSPDRNLFSVPGPVGPLRRAWPWAVSAVIVGVIVYGVARNPNIGWGEVGVYLFNSQVLDGLLGTVELTVLAGVVSLVLGAVVLALGRTGSVGRAFATAWVWFFRAVPLMVQLVIWFNAALIVRRVSIPLPGGFHLLDVPTNSLISAFTAAILGLALHESAYVAEILRGGLLAVPAGQYRAAAAIGMTAPQAYRYVIGPEVVRVTVPALTNQMIGLLKATATVAFIGGADLLTKVTQIYEQNFKTIPLLIVATIWYLVLVALATLGQRGVERRFSSPRRSEPGLAPVLDQVTAFGLEPVG
ncbi:MAG: amino acid ABC transporter permease [Acidobacteriota bacterium]|nr:amino acid ABC transporter permease [Acidobacteriota bacterium]